MDSDSAPADAIDAEGTPIGSANQEVSLPNSFLRRFSPQSSGSYVSTQWHLRPEISILFRERHQTTDNCRCERHRKLIRFSARGSVHRIAVRFRGMRPRAARDRIKRPEIGGRIRSLFGALICPGTTS